MDGNGFGGIRDTHAAVPNLVLHLRPEDQELEQVFGVASQTIAMRVSWMEVGSITMENAIKVVRKSTAASSSTESMNTADQSQTE